MGKHFFRKLLLLIMVIVICYFAKERINIFLKETILKYESNNTTEDQKPGDQLFDKIKQISDLWRKLNKQELYQIFTDNTNDQYLSEKTQEKEHTTQTDSKIENKLTETTTIATEKNIMDKANENDLSDENDKQLKKKWEGAFTVWSSHYQPKTEKPSGPNNETYFIDRSDVSTTTSKMTTEDITHSSFNNQTVNNENPEISSSTNQETLIPINETYFFDCISTEENTQAINTEDKISSLSSMEDSDPASNTEPIKEKTVTTKALIDEESKTINIGYKNTTKKFVKETIHDNVTNINSSIKYRDNQIENNQNSTTEKPSLFSVSPELSSATNLEDDKTLSPISETYSFDFSNSGRNNQTTNTKEKTSMMSSTNGNGLKEQMETKNGTTVVTNSLNTEDNTSTMQYYLETREDDKITLSPANGGEPGLLVPTINGKTFVTNSSINGDGKTTNKKDLSTSMILKKDIIPEETTIRSEKNSFTSFSPKTPINTNQGDNISLSPTYETSLFDDSDNDEKNQTNTTKDEIILILPTKNKVLAIPKNYSTEVANSPIDQGSKTITQNKISSVSSSTDRVSGSIAEIIKNKTLVNESLSSNDSEKTNKVDKRNSIAFRKANLGARIKTDNGKTGLTNTLIVKDNKTTTNISDEISSMSFSEDGDSRMHNVIKTTTSVPIVTSNNTCEGKYINISVYDLLISYNITHLWGEVALTMLVSCPTNLITLDFGGISVSISSLHEAMPPEKHRKCLQDKIKSVDVKSMDYDKQKRKIIIESMNKIKPEFSYILSLDFISELNAFERGVTLTKFWTRSKGNQNERRWIIETFLFPNFGKLVFPCIEAPEKRSVFQLRLNRNRDDEAVSNTLKVKTEMLSKNVLLDNFAQTPAIPISSFMFNILPKYDFLIVERTPSLAFWFPPHLRHSVEQIVYIADQILDFYIGYFQYNLPIQQISVVVVEDLYSDPPASFATILISSKYLFEKYEMNYEDKENLYHFLAKQFCDLWIGNIVSFNSWNDHWIKEGFSIYMAHLATMDIYDDYDFSSFMMRIQQNAFRHHRLPLFNEIYKDELYTNSTVGNYTPSKGAFLLHMVYNILKPQPFQEAIRFFFKEWALQSVSQDVFWNSFNMIQGNFDVKEFINSRAFSYHPTLNVDYENNTIVVKKVQHSGSNNHYDSWWIPISYFTGNDMDFDYTITHWLKQEQIVQIKFNFNDTWIIFNPQYSGFVHFNYSKHLWKMIINELRKGNSKLPSSIKAQLLDDAFTLASESLLDYGIPMTMALYLRDEEEYTPWFVALKHFSYLADVIIHYPERQIFQKYMTEIMYDISQKLQITTNPVVEKEIQSQLRKILMSWSCMNDLPNGCEKWALNEFLKWKDDSSYLSKNLIHTELRSIIYCMGAKFYDDETSKYIYNFSKTLTITSGEALRLLRGVTCTNESTTFMEIMNDMLDTSNPAFSFLRLKEFALSLKQSRINSLLSFQYLKDHWQIIYERFHDSNDILNAIIEGSTYFLRTQQYYDEVLALKKSVPQTDYSTLASFDLAIDEIVFNMNWDMRNLNNFRKWLKFYDKTLT